MDLNELSREDYLALSDDERPHLYQDRAPSNATYTGSKNVPGCRCVRCKAAHAEAVKARRKVIRVEPESVTDFIPGHGPTMPLESPQIAQEAPAPAAEVSVNPPVSQVVYSAPAVQLTSGDVTEGLAKRARKMVAEVGSLEGFWETLGQRAISQEFGVLPDVAARAVNDLLKKHVEIMPTGGLRLRGSGTPDVRSAILNAGTRPELFPHVRLPEIGALTAELRGGIDSERVA